MKTKNLITTVALVLAGLAGYAYTDNLAPVASPTIIPNRGSIQAATIKQTANSNANARHSEGITYDEDLGMLVFKDVTTFNNTMTSLADALKNFQYDNGKTEHLLDLLTKKDKDDDNDDGDLSDELEDNSPLSDTVMITFLKGNYKPQTIKKIIELNIDFSERAEAIYNTLNLASTIRQEIDSLRINHIPQDFVLDAFESQFHGYTSYRDYYTKAEIAFLQNGGNPGSKDNPANYTQALSRVMSTLFDAKQEVKIGTTFLVLLPNREVQILNNKVDILNYIRQNGNIPINKAPANEPINGFPKSIAPPPVDTNIVVTPTGGDVGQINGGPCGGIAPIFNPANGRYSISLSVKGNFSYYWDFGDGYVSYKANPTHAYTTKGIFTVTGTVYDSYGCPCGGNGTVNNGSGSNGNNNPLSCSTQLGGSFSMTSSYLDYTFNGTNNGLWGTTVLNYSWNFGDGGVGSGSTAHHSYLSPSPNGYSVTLTITDPATNCSWVSSPQVANPTNGSSTPTPTCCIDNDRDSASFLQTDDKHSFTIVLKVKHLYIAVTNAHGLQVFQSLCDISGKVAPYHKILGVWLPMVAQLSSATLAGTAFIDGNCTLPGTSISAYAYSRVFYSEAHVYFPDNHIYVSVSSLSIPVNVQAYCFGNSDNTLSVDCKGQ
ncbi:MAG: PKD domain-containing protein [Bacteroidia bacterium]